MTCPRMEGRPAFEFLNHPDDGCCVSCGSLNADTFMARLEAGDVVLGPTDKNYKVYVANKGGAPFRQSYRTDDAHTTDQSQWVWATREVGQAKFYFDHLSEPQKKRFVELLNEKKLVLDFPGHFYRLPYFCVREKA